MQRLPLFFLQLLAYPLLAVAKSGVADSKVEARDVSSSAPTDFTTSIAPLLAKYCTGCHGGEKPKNDLSLEFGDAQQVEQRLVKTASCSSGWPSALALGEMPPEDRPKPNEAERDLLLKWINSDLLATHAAKHGSAQVARVRRLSKVEYANTVRDLFYFKEFKADDLPPDDIGYGFNNIADLLSISPNQLELYLNTAEQAIAQLDATAKPSPNWAKNDKTYWEPDDGVFLPIKNVELRFNNNQVRVRKVLGDVLAAGLSPPGQERGDRPADGLCPAVAGARRGIVHPPEIRLCPASRGPLLSLFPLPHRARSARGNGSHQRI